MAEQQQQRQTAYKVLAKNLVNGTYQKQEGFNPNILRTPSGRTVSRVRITGTVTDTYEKEDGSYAAITVDDGTATIRGKAFQDLEPLTGVKEGDVVELVGKIREYDNEIYIQAEHVFPRSITHELVHVLDVHEHSQEWRSLIDDVRNREQDDPEDIAADLDVDVETVEHIQDYIDGVGFDTGADTAAAQTSPDTAPQSTSQRAPHDRDSTDEETEDSQHKDMVLNLIKEHDTGDGADYSELLDAASLEEDAFEDVVNELLSDGTCYEPRPGKIKIL